MITLKGPVSFPEQGSKRTRFQSPAFRAQIFKHTPKSSFYIESEPGKSYSTKSSSDIVQCRTAKHIGQPMGMWSLTVLPRQDYLLGSKQILPGDWCRIESDINDGKGWRKILYGPVTEIR
jgi:hypothetical protein